MNFPTWLLWLGGTLLPLGAWWLLWRLALRRERCFGYNRALLLLAPLLAAALPLLPRPALPLWLGSAASPAAAPVSVLPALAATSAAPAVPAGWAGWPWLLVLYATGVALGLGRLAWQAGRLRQLAHQLPRFDYPGYALVQTGGQLPTSSFGRTVFWDETVFLNPAAATAVLTHELAHVRQGHTLDVLWLELWRAVLWPNPFAHLLLPALRLTHELLADREAAAQPGEAASYPALLAQLATQRLRGQVAFALLQPFTFSFTLTRIAMLKTQVPVRRWKQWLALPVLGGLLLAACKATSDQVIAPSKEARKTQFMASAREAFRQDSLHTGKGWRDPDPTRILQVDKDGSVHIEHVAPTQAISAPELPGGGGVAAIVQAIQRNLAYPLDARGQPLPEGRSFVTFTVAADGATQDLRIVKSLGPAYDAALTTAIGKLPHLVPAQQNGQPLPQSLTVPITFKPQQ